MPYVAVEPLVEVVVRRNGTRSSSFQLLPRLPVVYTASAQMNWPEPFGSTTLPLFRQPSKVVPIFTGSVNAAAGPHANQSTPNRNAPRQRETSLNMRTPFARGRRLGSCVKPGTGIAVPTY